MLARQKRREEYNRLLYVALTRAEDRLVVCGAKPKHGAPNEACWYNLIARGFARLIEVTEGEAACFELPANRRRARGNTARRPGSTAAHPPEFLGTPPKPEPARPVPLAPSRPEGVEFGPLPASASPLARVEQGADRFQRGQLIHGSVTAFARFARCGTAPGRTALPASGTAMDLDRCRAGNRRGNR